MSLISHIRLDKGSYYDEAQGVFATPVGSKIGFAQTDKGIMLSDTYTQNSYVEIPNSTNFCNDTTWSITIPIFINDVNKPSGIISNASSVNGTGWFFVNFAAPVQLYIRAVSSTKILSVPASANKSKKHGLATIIKNGNVWSLYFDNVLYGTQTITDYKPSTLPVTLATFYRDNLSFGLNGSIGSPKIFNHALTESERNIEYAKFQLGWHFAESKANFSLPIPTQIRETGLVAAYNANSIQGSVAVDLSGNGRNGATKRVYVENDYIAFRNTTESDIFLTTYTILNSTFSVSMKFKSNLSKVALLFGANQSSWTSFNILIENTVLAVRYGDLTYRIQTNIVIGREYIVTVSVDKTNNLLSLYLNGAHINTVSISGLTITQLAATIGYKTTTTTWNFIGNIYDIRVYNKALTLQDHINYHNSFRKPILLETFIDTPVGQFPKGWIKQSGSFVVKERQSGKYIECTASGVAKVPLLYNSLQTASIEYFDGTNWNTYTGLLSALLTTHAAWLSYATTYLSFNLTTGRRIANLKVYNQ